MVHVISDSTISSVSCNMHRMSGVGLLRRGSWVRVPAGSPFQTEDLLCPSRKLPQAHCDTKVIRRAVCQRPDSRCKYCPLACKRMKLHRNANPFRLLCVANEYRLRRLAFPRTKSEIKGHQIGQRISTEMRLTGILARIRKSLGSSRVLGSRAAVHRSQPAAGVRRMFARVPFCDSTVNRLAATCMDFKFRFGVLRSRLTRKECNSKSPI
jgi:hypothetical protein